MTMTETDFDDDVPEGAPDENQDTEATDAEAVEALNAAGEGAPSATDPLVRMIEALLFAAAEPLDKKQLAERLPPDVDIDAILAVIADTYASRGVNLVCVAGRWTFRTAPDLAFLLRKDTHEQKKLSRAGVETLAIIAYHQPVTRAEIEEIRGVVVSKGTLDVLMETGWVTPRGRRQTPGKPLLFGTTDAFLDHFGLASLNDLPGLEELKAAGMLDPMAAATPAPMDEEQLAEPPDEESGMDEPLQDELMASAAADPARAADPTIVPAAPHSDEDEPLADGLNDGA